METESATIFVGAPYKIKLWSPNREWERQSPLPTIQSSIPTGSKWETSPHLTTKKLQPPCLQDAGKKPPLNCSPYGPWCCPLVQGWPLCPIPRCHNPGHMLHLDFLHSSTPNLQVEEAKVIRQASPADPPNHHTRWRVAAVTRQGWGDGAEGQEEAPGPGSHLLSV